MCIYIADFSLFFIFVSHCYLLSKHKEIVMDKLSKAETNGELSPVQAVMKAAASKVNNNSSVPHSVPVGRTRKLRSRLS